MKMDVIGYVLGGGVVVCVFGTLFVLEEESIPGVWAILLAIITLILGGLLFLRLRKLGEQRTKEFKRISEQLGMTFSARVKGRAKDRATPPLPLFGEGRSRVVTNMLHGDSELLGFAEEFEVRIFAYGFAQQQQDQHVMQSVICFQSPQLNLPKFQLCPESFHNKLWGGRFTGDIDFESHQAAAVFSKKYLLRGKDEQKIRALFTDEVLAFFAGQDKICVEGFSSHLCFYRALKLIEPEDIPAFMKEGFEVFRLFA
jgi:hypothetical protein